VFDPESGQVEFVVDKVALGQVFSEYFGFPCQFSFHQLLHNHPHLSSWAGTIGQKWPQYKGLSPTPLAIKEDKNGYLTTLSATQIIQQRKFWMIVDNELEGMWKEVFVAYFKTQSRGLSDEMNKMTKTSVGRRGVLADIPTTSPPEKKSEAVPTESR
jgi:hypothetical protein